jgi:hypothetical protein
MAFLSSSHIADITNPANIITRHQVQHNTSPNGTGFTQAATAACTALGFFNSAFRARFKASRAENI